MSSFQPLEVLIGSPVETLSDGSVKFQNDLENVPDDFVEIIHDLHRIDVQVEKFGRITPYDGMGLQRAMLVNSDISRAIHYKSKGVLFLASHPIEWINKRELTDGDLYRDPSVDWHERYSIGISDSRLRSSRMENLRLGNPDKQPSSVKPRCMCGKEGLINETCDACGYKFAYFRNTEHQKNDSGAKLLSKFRQLNIASTQNGHKWKGNDYGTGLKKALSNDHDIARLDRDVGVLEIHSYSQEYQGWVIEGGSRCSKITNSARDWRALNKIAQYLLEIDINALMDPSGKGVDEDTLGSECRRFSPSSDSLPKHVTRLLRYATVTSLIWIVFDWANSHTDVICALGFWHTRTSRHIDCVAYTEFLGYPDASAEWIILGLLALPLVRLIIIKPVYLIVEKLVRKLFSKKE